MAQNQSLGRPLDHCINYHDDDFSAEVLALTEGRGADVIYDPVGGEIFERSVSCTASAGRLLVIGFASGRWGSANTGEMVMRNCSVLGVFVGAYTHQERLEAHAALAELYGAQKIAVQIDEEVGMEDVAECLTRLEQQAVQGKLVVAMQHETE